MPWEWNAARDQYENPTTGEFITKKALLVRMPGEYGADLRGVERTLTPEFNSSPPEQSKPTNPKDAIGVAKLPLHLVSPLVEAYQAIAHFLGNVKYGAWNYRGAGIRNSIYYAALKRHMGAWWEGEEYDPVDGTPHLANALCCINILIEGKHAKNAVDDRPPSQYEELRKVREEFEALMPKIVAKYGDKNPRHFTISDTEEVKSDAA